MISSLELFLENIKKTDPSIWNLLYNSEGYYDIKIRILMDNSIVNSVYIPLHKEWHTQMAKMYIQNSALHKLKKQYVVNEIQSFVDYYYNLETL